MSNILSLLREPCIFGCPTIHKPAPKQHFFLYFCKFKELADNNVSDLEEESCRKYCG